MFPKSGTSTPSAENFFRLPVERWIACTRLVLALVALTASLLDPNFDAAGYGSRILLIAFGIYAAVLLLANQLDSRLHYGVAAGDIAASSILMYFTEGAASPFFPFFLFINLAAALRGGWRAALATAGVLTFILVALFFITHVLLHSLFGQ